MSIINDALKKVQNQLDKNEQTSNLPSNTGINKMDNQTPSPNASSPNQNPGQNPQKDLSEFLPIKEKSLAYQPPQIISETITPARAIHWGRILLTSAILILILTAAIYFYLLNVSKSASLKRYRIVPKTFKVSFPIPPVIKQSMMPTKSPETKNGNLVVSGIITMGDRQVALINNQIYEVGDKIEGKEIISITERTVEIRDGKQTQTLNLQN